MKNVVCQRFYEAFTWLSRHLLSSCSRVCAWACTYTQKQYTKSLILPSNCQWSFAGNKDKKTSCNLSLLITRALFFGSLSKCLWQQCKEDAVLFYTQPLKPNTRLPSNMTHKQLWCTGAFNQWRVGDNTPSVFICIMTTGTAWWLVLMTRGPACPCPACWLDGEVCGG